MKRDSIDFIQAASALQNLQVGEQLKQLLEEALVDDLLLTKANESVLVPVQLQASLDDRNIPLNILESPAQEAGGLRDIFWRYREFKRGELKPSSLKNLNSVIRKIEDFPTDGLTNDAARQISQHLLRTYTRDSARRALQQLGAACKWAIAHGELENNPFENLQLKKKKKRPRIDPFSEQEKKQIIAGFQDDPKHQHYAQYVEFLFLSGCRISEVVGLRWADIEPDRIRLWSPVVERQRNDSLKTGDIRFFPINSQLQDLIDRIGRRGESDSVFSSEQGALVDAGNFLRRHWKPVLEGLRIRYRKAQNTRHTFATSCLAKGVPPVKVAQLIGDNLSTLMRHYAGFIPGHVPEL